MFIISNRVTLQDKCNEEKAMLIHSLEKVIPSRSRTAFLSHEFPFMETFVPK